MSISNKKDSCPEDCPLREKCDGKITMHLADNHYHDVCAHTQVLLQLAIARMVTKIEQDE